MATVSVGTIDVFLIAALSDGWRVLALQRSLTTRCPTAWETIHGRIERGEQPEQAAVREVREETGLTAERLYNVCVQPFYLHKTHTVELSVCFAAFVTVSPPSDASSLPAVTLGEEHRRYEWLTPEAALARFVWPRERAALRDVMQLLASGDAGPVEDVLRVR